MFQFFIVFQVAHKILSTGKYLNVIRQCGKLISSQHILFARLTKWITVFNKMAALAHLPVFNCYSVIPRWWHVGAWMNESKMKIKLIK